MQTRAPFTLSNHYGPLIMGNPYAPFGLSLSKATRNRAGFQELPCTAIPTIAPTPVIPSAARNLKSLPYRIHSLRNTFYFLPFLCALRALCGESLLVRPLPPLCSPCSLW